MRAIKRVNRETLRAESKMIDYNFAVWWRFSHDCHKFQNYSKLLLVAIGRKSPAFSKIVKLDVLPSSVLPMPTP